MHNRLLKPGPAHRSIPRRLAPAPHLFPIRRLHLPLVLRVLGVFLERLVAQSAVDGDGIGGGDVGRGGWGVWVVGGNAVGVAVGGGGVEADWAEIQGPGETSGEHGGWGKR